MGTTKRLPARWPRTLELPDLGTLDLCTDCHASSPSAGGRKSGRVLLDLGTTAVLEGPPDAKEKDAGPVYRTREGTLIVPTGRLFVRFAEGEAAESHRASLAGAGLDIEAVPGYAPHAAWVRPRRGGSPAAVRLLEKAERLAGVERVELEMLRSKSSR